jgi:hypothetical protein
VSFTSCARWRVLQRAGAMHGLQAVSSQGLYELDSVLAVGNFVFFFLFGEVFISVFWPLEIGYTAIYFV